MQIKYDRAKRTMGPENLARKGGQYTTRFFCYVTQRLAHFITLQSMSSCHVHKVPCRTYHIFVRLLKTQKDIHHFYLPVKP